MSNKHNEFSEIITNALRQGRFQKEQGNQEAEMFS